MQVYCIACNARYFWNDDDEDCTKFVCSYCMSLNPERDMSAWARLRFRILNRDGFKCRYCGNSPLKDKLCVLHVDHVIARSKVMSNGENNLITACAVCNLGKLNFDLSDSSKQSVKEYLKTAEENIRNGINKATTAEEYNEMENRKDGGGIVADSQSMGEGSIQANGGAPKPSRKDGKG